MQTINPSAVARINSDVVSKIVIDITRQQQWNGANPIPLTRQTVQSSVIKVVVAENNAVLFNNNPHFSSGPGSFARIFDEVLINDIFADASERTPDSDIIGYKQQNTQEIPTFCNYRQYYKKQEIKNQAHLPAEYFTGTVNKGRNPASLLGNAKTERMDMVSADN